MTGCANGMQLADTCELRALRQGAVSARSMSNENKKIK